MCVGDEAEVRDDGDDAVMVTMRLVKTTRRSRYDEIFGRGELLLVPPYYT